MRIIGLVVLAIFFLSSPLMAQSFKIGTIVAKMGEATSGYLEVPVGVDEGASLPISIIHGAKPGPVLALIAGTHGSELSPITALQNIRQQIDPKTLSGTVIMVHVANMPSFLKRTIYYSPVDGKNLNRVYPGKENGTLSERIAFTITNEVIKRADYLVDMHGGDGNEALRPYIYMPVTNDEKINKITRAMALAFGVDHIIIDKIDIPDPDKSLYVDHTGLSLGVPSITSETGQLASNGPEWVNMAEQGVWNMLRHFRMIEGKNPEAKPVIWLYDNTTIRSPETGVFKASVHEGYLISKGAKIGDLYNLFGEPIMEITAPFTGVINYVIGTPPVSKGEPIAMVSKVKNP